MNAGSLRRPRCGIGAKKGESVSTRILSRGTNFTASRSSSAFLNVIIPENDMYNPRSRPCLANSVDPLKQWNTPFALECASRHEIVSTSASRV